MIIRKVYQDFARGDISAVFAAFDASIAWHVPGHSPLSGDYNGLPNHVGKVNAGPVGFEFACA
jgi:ketosteroid isomerase-like protein